MKKNSQMPENSATEIEEPMSADMFPIVGIAAQLASVEEIASFFQSLGDSAARAAFVVLVPLKQESALRRVLEKKTTLFVCEPSTGTNIQQGCLYLISGTTEVGFCKGTLLLHRPKNKRTNRPIDFFFQSLAAEYAHQSVGVILGELSGDGPEGLRLLKDEEGVTACQANTTSILLESIRREEIIDFVLPLAQLAEALARLLQHLCWYGKARDEKKSAVEEEEDIKKILFLLRSTLGTDFGDYKLSSLKRRIVRRMILCAQNTFKNYLDLLREDNTERQLLFEDLLIHVTAFFRDRQNVERLKEKVFPEILERKQEGDAIRIWVAGCATGEEVYSIAILLLEFLSSREQAASIRVQIFGTDLSEKAIEKARAGFYPENISRAVGEKRLKEYFSKSNGGYRINKSVRELCAFVKHDLAKDPPFSKMDLVSCRNVLIYFNHSLQKRVLNTFHFALNAPGFLLLGRSENILEASAQFATLDGESKIFTRVGGHGTLRLSQTREFVPTSMISLDTVTHIQPSFDVVRRAESLLLENYAPSGVVVNERLDILHFRGRTGLYLEPAPGQPQHNLLKMAREGLLSELRVAMMEAKKEMATIRREGIRVQHEGFARYCNLVVMPLTSPPESREHLFLVLFEDSSAELEEKKRKSTSSRNRSENAQVMRLSDELKATKDYLQSIIEDHQRTNYALISANEELISSNEELQSLNEELETAKEELQSINRELTSLNEELSVRNVELSRVNSDILNILSSVEVPIIIVDNERKIRRFTPKTRSILNLLHSDIGRPIDDINPRIFVDNFDQQIAEVIDTVNMRELEAQDRDGYWYRVQIRPYITVDKRIDGAVICIIDIDALKRALSAAEWSRDFATSTVEAVQTPLVVLDKKQRVISVNRSFRESFGLSREDCEGRSFYEVQDELWSAPRVRAWLKELQEPLGSSSQKLEILCEIPEKGRRIFLLSPVPVQTSDGMQMTLLSFDDVTEQRAEAEFIRRIAEVEAHKKASEDTMRDKELFLSTLSHELRTPLTSVLLHSQSLRRGELTEGKVLRASTAIEKAAKTQAQLVEDLLELSQLMTGKKTSTTVLVQVSQLLLETLDSFHRSIEEKSQVVQYEIVEDLYMLGDPARVQLMLTHVIGNAVKFTPAGGEISLSVRREEDAVTISCRDTGVGISPELLPRVFEAFYQEDQSFQRAYGGLGIGLSIVQHLVAAHQGHISVQSDGKGKGTTCVMSFPIAKR